MRRGRGRLLTALVGLLLAGAVAPEVLAASGGTGTDVGELLSLHETSLEALETMAEEVGRLRGEVRALRREMVPVGEPASPPDPGPSGGAVSTSKVAMQLGGYVKVAAHWDDNGKEFGTLGAGGLLGTGPVGTGRFEDSTFSITDGETRMSWSARGPAFDGWELSSLIEGHWWQGDLALRHAYIALARPGQRLLFGRSWSTFGSASFLPEELDYGTGIRTGTLFARVNQLRYGRSLGPRSPLRLQLALETDADSTQAPGRFTAYNTGAPWVVGTLSWEPSADRGRKAVYWHRVVGSRVALNLLRGAREETTDATTGVARRRQMQGWSLSGVFGLRPPRDDRRQGSWTLAGSTWAGNELQPWVMPAFGVVQGGGGTEVDGLPSSGSWLQLDHYPSEDLRVAVAHGVSEVDVEDGYTWAGSAADLKTNEKSSLSLTWQRPGNLLYGLEWGDFRSTYRDPSGSRQQFVNHRLSATAQYAF